MYAIGIDIGTTSICGVVLDTDTGKVVKSRTEQSNAFITTENVWEKIQDTEKVIALAVEILESFSEYPAEVIGLTGQMHGIVYVDGQGKAVSPLYTWQDGRGSLPYKDSTYAEFLDSFSGYGNVTDFYNQVNHIRPAEAVTHCTIMDYLAMVLCGLRKPHMHTTNAASLGCFDLKTNTFNYDVDVKVSSTFEIAGYYRGIPVSIAIGDNQASVFSTLSDERDLLVNIGTGSQISIISEKIITEDNIETRPYMDGKYLVVGAALCGGRAYGILKDFFVTFLQAAECKYCVGHEKITENWLQTDVYSIMNSLIANRLQNSLKVDTRFAGTRKDPTICGSISGITVDNFTPANLIYSVLEGMMEELYDMYERMGERRKNLVGSGNGIRKNKTLIRIAENRFRGTLRIPVHTEEAAYGAALFGLVSCGAFESTKQAQKLIQYEGEEPV